MASQMHDGTTGIDVHGRLGPSLAEWQEPGATELCDLVQRMLNGNGSSESVDLERLKTGVYRLRIGSDPVRTVVLKCLTPALAHTDRLVAERWLPALGLGDRTPRLLAGAAQRDGCWVWHAYEDLGNDESLNKRRGPEHLGAAVALIAELHTRAANHPLMPEVRWRANDYGPHFFTSNVCDAISALEAVGSLSRPVPEEFTGARQRLLQHLSALRADFPRRVALMQRAGGPDTLLHGDLWPKNVFVAANGHGVHAQLIDWDHVGTGPFTYDLSTLLYRSAPAERPWMLEQYRSAVERAGWRLPAIDDLNLLLHTAECSRYAHCVIFIAIALLHDNAEWPIQELIDWDGYFAALRQPLSI
jgi:thiamine kinase-like enzyme